MARTKEKEKRKGDRWEPIWSSTETDEPQGVEGEVAIQSAKDTEIDDLEMKMGQLQETLGSFKEVMGKIGGLEDKMGELSSIYEAFISRYSPLESEKREGLLETEEGGKQSFSPEDDLMVLEWVDYLLEVLPREEVGKRLSYFLEIGWLDEELYERALNLLHGLVDFTEGRFEGEKWKMMSGDYVRSLLFLESLRGKPLDINRVRAVLFKAKNTYKEENLEV